MDLRIFTEPQQGATYDDLLRVAQATERLGYDGFFRSDHFLAMSGDGLPGPTDAWTTLAGLARETERIRLGTLVSSVTFRHPSVLAIQVAQVDQMSGGRIELGLGTGWLASEHAAYGIPFPGRRFGMLAEQLEVITGLWSTPVGGRFDHSGERYTLSGAPALPKPVQRRAVDGLSFGVPVIIGGNGPRRTPALVARFASEYNAAFPELTELPAQLARVRSACEEVGRSPDDLVYSAALVLCVGSDEAELGRRAAAIRRQPAELREHGIAGTVPEVADRLGALGEAGVSRVYLQVLDLADLDHLELVAQEVVPRLG
ncbi:MAG TPA: LLM class F420-dependent oxidoreductase [Actinotalea sp.]